VCAIIQFTSKLERIMDIWLDKCGVIILQVFHNTSDSEACTREAAMIDAIGIILMIFIMTLKYSNEHEL
jgi:hypothetical protein